MVELLLKVNAEVNAEFKNSIVCLHSFKAGCWTESPICQSKTILREDDKIPFSPSIIASLTLNSETLIRAGTEFKLQITQIKKSYSQSVIRKQALQGVFLSQTRLSYDNSPGWFLPFEYREASKWQDITLCVPRGVWWGRKTNLGEQISKHF